MYYKEESFRVFPRMLSVPTHRRSKGIEVTKEEDLYFNTVNITKMYRNIHATLNYYSEYLEGYSFSLSLNVYRDRDIPHTSYNLPKHLISLEIFTPGLKDYSYPLMRTSIKDVQDSVVCVITDINSKKLNSVMTLEVAQRTIDERKDL